MFVEHETLAKIARDELVPRSDEERTAAAEAASGQRFVGDASDVSARAEADRRGMISAVSRRFASS